jgi:hypothetical protein
MRKRGYIVKGHALWATELGLLIVVEGNKYWLPRQFIFEVVEGDIEYEAGNIDASQINTVRRGGMDGAGEYYRYIEKRNELSYVEHTEANTDFGELDTGDLGAVDHRHCPVTLRVFGAFCRAKEIPHTTPWDAAPAQG